MRSTTKASTPRSSRPATPSTPSVPKAPPSSPAGCSRCEPSVSGESGCQHREAQQSHENRSPRRPRDPGSRYGGYEEQHLDEDSNGSWCRDDGGCLVSGGVEQCGKAEQHDEGRQSGPSRPGQHRCRPRARNPGDDFDPESCARRRVGVVRAHSWPAATCRSFGRRGHRATLNALERERPMGCVSG